MCTTRSNNDQSWERTNTDMLWVIKQKQKTYNMERAVSLQITD